MIVYPANIAEHSNWTVAEEVICQINARGVFVSFCDIFFNNSTSPITETWYGIIHNPFGWEMHTPWGAKTTLFQTDSFLASLPHCKGLFVMANTQVRPLNNLLAKHGFRHISVVALVHPINALNSTFDYDKYVSNPQKTIYSIGNWLRKQYSIFKLQCHSKFTKAIIPFTNRTRLELDYYTKRDSIVLSRSELNSVKNIDYVDSDTYHKIFEKNIVFLDVYLTTINNTFLECVISNTPIILNRHQEYVDLIGGDYPLFFDTIDDINSYIETDDNILRAHEYLKRIDKTKFSLSFFKRTLETHICS